MVRGRHGEGPAWSGSGEGFLLSLQAGSFLLYLHMIETQRKRSMQSDLFLRALVLPRAFLVARR